MHVASGITEREIDNLINFSNFNGRVMFDETIYKIESLKNSGADGGEVYNIAWECLLRDNVIRTQSNTNVNTNTSTKEKNYQKTLTNPFAPSLLPRDDYQSYESDNQFSPSFFPRDN